MPENTSGTTNKDRKKSFQKKYIIDQKFHDEAHQLFEPVTKTVERAHANIPRQTPTTSGKL